jgi:hypothetical protein
MNAPIRKESCHGCVFAAMAESNIECRRYAPRATVGPVDPDDKTTWACWPVVLEDDWCGEWVQR